jgi:hypothetical protein
MPDAPRSSRTLPAELRMYPDCSRSFQDNPGRLPGLYRVVGLQLKVCHGVLASTLRYDTVHAVLKCVCPSEELPHTNTYITNGLSDT